MRGEQSSFESMPIHLRGSPPLARGTATSCTRRITPLGITPACAGNRRKDRQMNRSEQDHPRLRGEQTLASVIGFGDVGSPPLARGTVFFTASSAPKNGITPACAGNRLPVFTHIPACWDHPRLRGEQIIKKLLGDSPEGSPPLARGTANPFNSLR